MKIWLSHSFSDVFHQKQKISGEHSKFHSTNYCYNPAEKLECKGLRQSMELSIIIAWKHFVDIL